MATFADVIYGGMKAAGLDVDSEAMKAWLQSDRAQKEVTGDPLEAFQANFMTMEQALKNPGIEAALWKVHSKQLHGTHMQKIEDAYTAFANANGIDRGALLALKEEHGDLSTRIPALLDMVKQTGSGKGGDSGEVDEQVKALQARLDTIKGDHAQALQLKAAEAERATQELADERKNFKNFRLTKKIVGDIKKKFKFNSETPEDLIDMALERNIENGILSKFSVIHNGTDIDLRDKESPTRPPLDDNGHPLKYNEVLESIVDPRLLKKEDDGNGGGAPPKRIPGGGNGGNGTGRLNADQQARLAKLKASREQR